MPLTLPFTGVQCLPRTQLISIENKRIEAKEINGGAHFSHKIHYLREVNSGLCYFGCTKDNSFWRDGLMLVVSLGDIDTKDFRSLVMRMVLDGKLSPADTNWYKFHPTDELPRI